MASAAAAAGSDARAAERWLAVTVNVPPDRVRPAELPEPLARLGDHVEVRITPAPGDKGTSVGPAARRAGTAAGAAGAAPGEVAAGDRGGAAAQRTRLGASRAGGPAAGRGGGAVRRGGL
jgi:hypothetical protein